MSTKQRIAVLAGGYSGEHDVSLRSATTVMAALDRQLFEPTLIIVSREGWVADYEGVSIPIDRSDLTLESEGEKVRFDFAYIIIHGTPGEDGKLQGYLDMLGIPYNTGSALSTAITFDKGATQTILRGCGFSVTDFVHLRKGSMMSHQSIIEKIGLPCFVKPSQAGSSLGISKIKREEDLAQAIEDAFAYCDSILIESFLDGREITCGVVRTGDEVVALPVTEVVCQGEFFDYDAKYNDAETQEITPAPIDKDAYSRCQLLAKEVVIAMDCRGVARVDFFLVDGELFVVEVNTVPGMSPASIIPKMVKVAGLDMTSLLSAIIKERIYESNTH